MELKREGGKRVKVRPSIFVAEDQAYIKEWDAVKAFTSGRLLKISCDDNQLDKWKEEEWKDVRYTSGNVEKELMKTTTFDINFHN